MDNRPPSSQAEDETCQSSSSGYPLEVTVYEEIPGPSGEGAGTRRNFRGLTGKEEWVQRSGKNPTKGAYERKETFGKPGIEGGEHRSCGHGTPGEQERRLGDEIQG